MTVNPSQDYIKLSKYMESFGCFFEKICSQSTTPNKNLKKLFEFKKVFYSNLDSPDSLYSAVEDLSHFKSKPSQSHFKTSPIISKTTGSSNIQKSDQQQSESLQRNSVKNRSASSSQVQDAARSLKTQIHEWQPPVSLHSEFVPISNFLARIKAASHGEIAKLFSLSSSYSFTRTLNERQNPVFVALFLCYFENILRAKDSEHQSLLIDLVDNKIPDSSTLADIKEDEFYNFLRESLQNHQESENITKFYESMMKNPSLYYSGVKTFKEIFIENFSRNPQENNPSSDSFEWLNELENLETNVLQDLAKLFNTSFRLLVLTKTKLVDLFISSDKTTTQTSSTNSPREQPDNTIFFDRISNSIYILYPTESHLEESPKDSLRERTKLKTYSSNPTKPPLDHESFKNLKEKSDFKTGSLPSLDPMSSPMTSLNELEKPEYISSQSHEIPRLSQGKKLPNLETFSSVTGSQREFSLTPTHQNLGSATTGRPSFDRAFSMGPQSCPKEANRFHFKGAESTEDRLTPKEKEPVPTRSNSYNYKEPTVSDDKVFGRLNDQFETNGYRRQSSSPSPFEPHQRQFGTQRSSKEIENVKSFGFDRTYTQDYSNLPYETKSKVDYLNPKIYSTNLPWRDSPVNDGTIQRPTGIPSVLKTKFDRVNQNVNQRDLDFDKLIGRYLRRGGSVDRQQTKNTSMTSLTNIYNNILGQNKENEKYKPSSVGAYLRMDL